MASSLNSEEELITKKFVSYINDLRYRNEVGPISWNTAVKFLMARKFDFNRTLELYRQHHLVRINEGLHTFDPTDEPLSNELETGKFTVLSGRNICGCAVTLFTARLHFPDKTTQQTTLQGLVYQLDVALESIDTQRNGIIFIYDMTDSKYSNFDYELSQKILTLLKGAYPARLKKVLIVTAPLWFRAPFKLLRLFVREKLRDRVYTVSIPQLKCHISPETLPQSLGGLSKISHQSWLLHCHKSMASRSAELCEVVMPTYGQIFQTSQITDDFPRLDTENNVPMNDASLIDASRDLEVPYISDSELLFNGDGIKHSPKRTNSPAAAVGSSVSSGFSDEGSLHGDDGRGLTIEEFIEHVRRKGRIGLTQEYAEFKNKSPDGTFDCSRLEVNMPKNRYTDVLCYDHSRVIQSCDNDNNSDYINANYVDGYKQKSAFISTQGPLPNTCIEFWQMIWEQQTVVIVMTTRVLERGRVKCGQYWPREEETCLDFGPYVITNVGIEPTADYTITYLDIFNKKTDDSRRVVHMQYTSWPDYGVPYSAMAMLEFLARVREQQSEMVINMGDLWVGHPLGPPIVVHCSAGIGRTGTFCTLDICIKRLEDTGLIDVQSTVEKIRSQRANSIQMPDQYIFCHLALLEYAVTSGHVDEIDLSGFEDCINQCD